MDRPHAATEGGEREARRLELIDRRLNFPQPEQPMTEATKTSSETAVAVAGSAGARPHEVIALNLPQLDAAHQQMIGWAKAQQVGVRAELAEERESLKIATHRKWATDPFKRRIARLEKRVQFFSKMEEALAAGFILIPNFDMDVFAIRTRAKTAVGGVREGRFNNFVQPAQLLASGQGRYVDPNPFIHTETDTVPDGKGGTKSQTHQWPTGLDEAVSFPLQMARPMLMTKAGEAMALKVFDEIGVARDTQWRRTGTRGDPFLVGRIGNPNRGRAAVSFFLGWSFDPSRL